MDMATTKSPDTENDTPPQSQPLKPLSTITTNGAYKKHHHQYYSPPQVVTYKECLKNHAARIGSHALDGCGEFMPSPTSTPTDPTSLKCAACGCHRNFHRQEPDDSATPHHFLTFHRHNSSPPPPPMETLNSFSYAPNILLALSTAAHDDHPSNNHHLTPATPTAVKGENPSGRKRFRTKFSREQKEKMQSFSEKLGWRMQKSDEIMVEEFCRAIGVGKNVLKVWMHNNKSTLGKSAATIITTNNKKDDVIGSSKSNINGGKAISFENDISHNVSRNNNSPSDDDVHLHISAYGSSSSS